MSTRISEAELSSRLPEILNRVSNEGESFVIERDGAQVAKLEPAEPFRKVTWAMLAKELGELRSGDPTFADDLEKIQASQPLATFEPWPD
jgi:antitoxin (DNA-binding transcriptional repressor) of toxin-antitoxin stability system